MTSPIDQAWPAEGLERVEACPYCGSNRRSLAYKDVQDWSFNCAPGKWDYWDCLNCQSLYLNPRPTRSSIGLAYAKYYTHNDTDNLPVLIAIKERLRNECISLKLNANIQPRLHLPKLLNAAVSRIGNRVVMPFGWTELANLNKGRFIDVGCGAGLTVSVAHQLGWDAMGLEIDPAAVREARRDGLNIIEGTYEELNRYENRFNYVMCSHVLEHVHEPRDLLAKLRSAIMPGGVLFITLPNSLSAVRRHFGANWRGLEAPRHLSIPSESYLRELLSELGFSIQSLAYDSPATAGESQRIQRRGARISRQDLVMARQMGIRPQSQLGENDFIKLVCKVPMGVSK